MKRAIFALLLMLFAGAAGAIEPGSIRLGATAGIVSASITEAPAEWDDDLDWRTGFIGGLFLEYAITGQIGIRPELLYATRGVEASLYDGFVDVDLDAAFSYIELPLLLTWTIAETERFRPFLRAGPCFCYRLDAEVDVSVLLFSAGVDFTDLTHTTDVALIAAAGCEIALGPGYLIVEGRFHRGLTNVILSGDFEINGSRQTISEDDFKNVGVLFLVGYAP
ncbi:MAG: PorT family protein [Candidatus Krumholzibacteriota bacterium]|nr:PorT family protein [Candidatus Krumholzibacteriota bacterium]